MSVNNIGLKSYEDLFKDEKGRKTEEIVPVDIRESTAKMITIKGVKDFCDSYIKFSITDSDIQIGHSLMWEADFLK